MHNRLRMAVGMFATKDLLFDWRLVENWFARNLCDYDPCSNSGGVQWCSSVGFDSVPYFRIFSPWIQLKKFDPNCEYVKKYVHELKYIPTEHIHNWDIFHKNYKINYATRKKNINSSNLLLFIFYYEFCCYTLPTDSY
jgi:deoxyribodipyrimidine photo-lyase